MRDDPNVPTHDDAALDRDELVADGFDPDGADRGLDLEERHALRRVAGLSTELEDVTEVEYRQVRLERVVLAGVWTSGTLRDAERGMAELALLAETAGSVVLEGVIQRRDTPDPATYLGSGKARELREIVVASGADTVICDGELVHTGVREALGDEAFESAFAGGRAADPRTAAATVRAVVGA